MSGHDIMRNGKDGQVTWISPAVITFVIDGHRVGQKAGATHGVLGIPAQADGTTTARYDGVEESSANCLAVPKDYPAGY